MNGGTLIAIMVVAFLVCELVNRHAREVPNPYDTITTTDMYGTRYSASTTSHQWWIEHIYVNNTGTGWFTPTGDQFLPYIDWTNPELPSER